MEPWEEHLLANTQSFIRTILHHVPPEKRQQLIARIYQDMHETLKLFHQDRTPPEKPATKSRR
jgi:hypothetical protein